MNSTVLITSLSLAAFILSFVFLYAFFRLLRFYRSTKTLREAHGQARQALEKLRQDLTNSHETNEAIILKTEDRRVANLRLEEANSRLQSQLRTTRSQLQIATARVKDPFKTVSGPFPLLPFHDGHAATSPPEPRDYQLYYQSDVDALSVALATIFPDGWDMLTEEKQCIDICRFVASHVKLGETDIGASSTKILKEQIASCGGLAWLFCDLARSIGLAARYTGFYGLRGAGSHALAEVFYNGSWHLFDPTFGIFFYSRPEYADGHVLSAVEISIWPILPPMMQVLGKPWQRNYAAEASFGVKPTGKKPISHETDYWNAQTHSEMFPIAFGNTSSIVFPVRLDLSTEDTHEIGKADGSWKSVYDANVADPETGYFSIGGRTPVISHLLDVSLPEPGHFEISLAVVEDELIQISVVPTRGAFLYNRTQTSRVLTLRFKANRKDPSVLIWTHRTYSFDQIIARRVDTPRSVAEISKLS